MKQTHREQVVGKSKRSKFHTKQSRFRNEK